MSRNLRALLDERVRAAMAAAGVSDAVAVITPAARPEFGDYQANGVMQAAKRIARNPRELAADVVAKLESRAESQSASTSPAPASSTFV